MSRCNCTPKPKCNPGPLGASQLNYDGTSQAPHPYVYWMAKRTVNVAAGKNVEVKLDTDCETGDKTYTVSSKTDPGVTSRLDALDTALVKKADKTYVDRELAKKADKTYVNTELAKKADKTYVNAELTKKADKTYVNAELTKKADKTYVNTELAKKADKTYVDTELIKKADKAYVDTELVKKADKVYVDTELAKKPNKEYVDAELAKKVSKSYVDSELAKKADKVYVDTELSGKVDKVEGKGLSSNDYTDADKEKLTSITWLPSAEQGEDLSLVTTGEKYAWDAKQEKLEYYLSDAQVVDGTLYITRLNDDGSTEVVSFAGTGVIDQIAVEEDGLLPIVAKRVTIPLATYGTIDEPGMAGLVKGNSGEFDSNGLVTNSQNP